MNTYETISEKYPEEASFPKDENALGQLLNKYKSRLYMSAYVLVKDRDLAHDIFQEACIKIIVSIRKGKYIEEGKFLPWATRIVRNLCIDFIRKNKKMSIKELPDGKDITETLSAQEKTTEQKMIHETNCETVRRLLNHIPYEQREVIILRLYGNLSFKQIAELTDVSINTALGRMRYGLLGMRKLLKERNFHL